MPARARLSAARCGKFMTSADAVSERTREVWQCPEVRSLLNLSAASLRPNGGLKC
jgi:hypothetical protein